MDKKNYSQQIANNENAKLNLKMKNKILFTLMLFIITAAFSQINFKEKVNLYDYDSLSVHLIYDDFDFDNDIDIIKSNTKSVGITLLQKNENGDFNSIPSILANTGKNPIISLDLNNDNFPDLITYHSFNTIGVLYNLKNDKFSEEEFVQNFSGSYSIDPIKYDYDNDGFMDLIVKGNDNKAYLLRNNKIGGLEAPQFLIDVGSFNTIYKIEDFDNDGDPDIYLYDSRALIPYLNNNGNFLRLNSLQTPSSLGSYGILDLDQNGIKDILYWQNGMIWAKYIGYNQNGGAFYEIKDESVIKGIPFYTSSLNGNSIFIKNKGVDNHDIYVALETRENQYNIYKVNVQNDTFSETEVVLPNFEINRFDLQQFNFLDFNNDDNIDFSFTSNFNENNMILINNDIDNITDKTVCIQQLVRPNNFSVIDMNGDGVEDICFGTQNGLGIFEKKNNGELSGMRNLIGVIKNTNASTYTQNHIIDLNNDQLGDIVDFDQYGDNIKIFKNLGNDNFEYIQSVAIKILTRKIYFIDIDSDGYKDILLINSDGGSGFEEYNWSKSNNGNSFDELQPLVINNYQKNSSVSLSINDFNKDNQMDIVSLNYYYENNQWKTQVNVLQNQNGVFTASNSIQFNGSDYGRGHLKVHDFDKDGDLDFFVYNINSNQNFNTEFLFLKNNENNNFQSILIENSHVEDIEFYDNDGDGIEEIYAWNYTPYNNHLFYYSTTDYLNFSKSEIDTYGASYDSSDPYSRGDLLLYDYNNDGKKDLFIDNFSSFQGLISVYKNLSTTLDIEEVTSNHNSNELKVFPNPFTYSISWKNKNNGTYDIELHSIKGQLVLEKKSVENKLDVSSLSKGIYLLSIKSKSSNHKTVHKIIKK